MWGLILGITLLISLAGVIFLATRFNKFSFIMKKVFGYLIVIVLCIILTLTLGAMNMMVVVLHLMIIWLICELVACLYRRIKFGNSKQPQKTPKNYRGAVAIIIAICYLSCGWYLAHNVWATYYDVKTDKPIGNFKVALIADSHMGTTFGAEGFAKQLERIQVEAPDILVIAGDYVDDDSNREDMVAACQALGELKTTYGVYYSFGNHDKGYYNNDRRGFDENDLRAELEKNGVTILEDESLLIDGRINLIGRQDLSEESRGSSRKAMKELVEESTDESQNSFSIVLDHQPSDYDNQAGLVDMVLSGHTHGGQLFPITWVGEWIGVNDKTYGYEVIDGTNFIVTSGISDWAIKFKTLCKSEYVIINIHN